MSLKTRERIRVTGERIVKIASSFAYVGADTPVHAILAELREPYRDPVAVVDPSERVLGIIVPKDLMEMLGKPFGRDLLQRQSAADVMRPVTRFRYDEYIQTARERVGTEIEDDPERHYALVDQDGRFQGHVSAQDILTHAMDDYRRELSLATAIQNRLVPPYAAERNGRVSITCSSVMAQGVGGDYYFTREYGPGQWFFCLCDISGKGISASVITAVISGFMYNAGFASPLEDTVARLNRIVIDTFCLEKYLTGFFAKFDERTGELEYCDMGHSWFYAVEGKTIQQVAAEADNVPVGLVHEPDIVPRTLRIAPGTVLALLSDGLIEQENRDGAPFPIGELGSIIGDAVGAGDDLVRAKVRVLERFFSFKGDVPQHDDISLLLFHFKAD